ncbi:MAG: MFS transporter [Bacilli bacterium]|nr:MFS transporter [Bacilli bacterium]
MDKNKFGWRNWISVILVGFAGQLAWAIENNYINLWVYSQTGDYKYITWMTMASAVVATLTTFFMGVLSDRLGKRKMFISFGYIVWGVTVFLFGVMSLGGLKNAFGLTLANAMLMCGIMNVVVDCLMTFFGSTSNDACFNAWVTDNTNEKNRPFVESILSVMPLFAMGAMIGIGGIFHIGTTSIGAGQTQEEFAKSVQMDWFYFFLVFGVVTTLIGIASLFLLPKDNIKSNRKEPYLKSLVYGFRPSTVKKTPRFYISLIAFMFFNIAVDSFMPYFMVYFQNPVERGGLGMGDSFLVSMILIMGIASLVVIVLGAFMEKIGKMKLIFPAIGFMALGALLLFFFKNQAPVIIAGTVMMIGYLVGTAVLGATLRDETPSEEVGLFQGVRMVGAVMLPMVIGSNISPLFFSSTYVDDLGQTVGAPDNHMFLVTAIVSIIAIAPIVWLIVFSKKRGNSSPSTSK